jgi:hypothetical protein
MNNIYMNQRRVFANSDISYINHITNNINKNNIFPVCIEEGKRSFIEYSQLLSGIEDCDYNQCKHITNIIECNKYKNYLYPYGNIVYPCDIVYHQHKLTKNKDCSCKCANKDCSYKCENKDCSCKPVNTDCSCKCANKDCSYKCANKDCSCKCANKDCINIYPSQHQFKYYNTSSLNDCNKDKRIDAFSLYPQIDKNNIIHPFPCDPCKPCKPCKPCDPCEPCRRYNYCLIKIGKYNINVCGGIPYKGCKCL